MAKWRLWKNGLRGIYVATCSGNKRHGLSGCIWGNTTITPLIICPSVWHHSDHYMAMMLLPLLICHLGIIELPNPRIEFRRARTFSRLSRIIYRWHKISRRLMQIGTKSRGLSRWGTWCFWGYSHINSLPWRKVVLKSLSPAFRAPIEWFGGLVR